MRPRAFVILGALGLFGLIIVLLAWLTRWQTAILGGLSLFGGLIGSLLLLVALIRLGRVRIARAVPSQVDKFLLLAAVMLLLQLAYIPIAQALRRQAIDRAQSWIGSLIPQIEAYRTQYGDYPPALEAVWHENLILPTLLRLHGNLPLPYDNRQFYVRRADTYGFEFYVPDGFIGFSYQYCCGAKGQWTVTD